MAPGVQLMSNTTTTTSPRTPTPTTMLTTTVEHLDGIFNSPCPTEEKTYQSLDKLSTELRSRRSDGDFNARPKRCRVPHRYQLVAMGGLGLLLTVGTRAFFALVVTHVTARNGTGSSVVIFSNCTAQHASTDSNPGLSGESMFMLHAVYFLGYFLICVPGSVICTWLSPVRLLGAMMLVDSCVTLLLPTIMGASVPLLFVARFLQGLAEGSQQPVLIGLISAWSTQETRASLTAVMISGVYISPTVAFVSTSLCLCYVSWGGIFYFYGSAGVLWSLVWLSRFHDIPQKHPNLSADERRYHATHGHTVEANSAALLKSIPWRSILKSPSLWCLCLSSFSRNFVFAALVVEQPQYFFDSFDMNTSDIGLLATVVHVGLTVSCVIGGSISDLLLRRGVPVTRVRKLITTAGSVVEGSCLLALYFIDSWKAAFLVLSFGVSLGGISIAGYVPVAGDLAPQFAGVITGLSQIGSSGAVISSVIASTLTGNVQTIESWQKMFLLAGCIVIVIMIIFDIFVDARRQSWPLDGGGVVYSNSNNHTTIVAANGTTPTAIADASARRTSTPAASSTGNGHCRVARRSKRPNKTRAGSPGPASFAVLFSQRRREKRTLRISEESEETELLTESLGAGDEDAFSQNAGSRRAGYGAVDVAEAEQCDARAFTVVSDYPPPGQHLSLLGF